MKTLSVVKKDLDFNRGLSSLIDVLKNIAVAQYRTLEQKIKSFEKFGQEVESFFDFIDLAQVDHPFVRPQNNSQAVVAVTSDSGLLGGLNMQVVSVAIAELEKIPGKLVVIGERGKMYAQESKIPFTAFPGIKDEERFGQAIQLRDYLVAKALEGSFHHLKIVYPRPISFTVQRIEKLSVLPFSLASQEKGLVKAIPDFISESSFADVAEYLLYLWLGQKIYEIFGLSRLAEFSARYVHLEESLQKLKEMDTKLRLEYFRVRHELIDRSMRELFSARLLYAQ